jgi:hypothetical protein
VQPWRFAHMQQKLDAQAKETAPPLFFDEALGEANPALLGTVATPNEQWQLDLPPPAIPRYGKWCPLITRMADLRIVARQTSIVWLPRTTARSNECTASSSARTWTGQERPV